MKSAKTYVRVAALASLGVLLLVQPALALEPVGGPAVDGRDGGWAQRFVVYNTTAFDQVQFAMVHGSAFATPDGFDPDGFVPDTWAQACNDGVRLIACGPGTNSLQFWVEFATPVTTPLVMYYQVYAVGGGMITEITAEWDGSEWTLEGDSPWSNARIDCACLHMGSLSLLTDPQQVCYGVGETVTINVFMSDIQDPYAIVGGQFFLSYNAAKLQFVEMTPGDAPFLKEIYEDVDPLAGTIDYSVGLNFGDSGTINDSVMAVITFTAINEICLTDSLVTFRDNDPPSMLTSGCCGDVCPLLFELAAIEIDSTPPEFDNCSGTPEEPEEVTVECHLLDETYPVYDEFGDLLVTAHDVCDDPDDPTDDVVVTFDQQREDGHCDATYMLTRTWTATDFCGNAAECVMIIHVEDTTAPCIKDCPPDDTVECSDLDTLYPVYDEFDNLLVTATDNCDEDPEITFFEEASYPDPECSGTYDLMRVWEATDECGNTAYCVQFLTVQDTTAPEWVDPENLPAHVTVACDAIPSRVDPPATDNCEEDLRLEYTEDISEHGDCQTYTITRTWTYDDYCGNSISHTQLISVVDEIAPEFSCCPEDVTVECHEVPEVPVLEATDNCPGVIPEISFVEFQTMLDDPECPQHYRLRRAWTATDGCGNFSECIQLITVVDTIAPVITCPEPIIVKADVGTCEAVLCPGAADAMDNCDEQPDVFGFRDDGDGICSEPYPIGDTTITWIARDDCGNENDCQQTVTVLPYNEMLVSLAIQATFPCNQSAVLSRCITFELWDCGNPEAPPVVYEAMIDFECLPDTELAIATDVLLEDVPCGMYTCVTARDELHTLRVTLGSPDFTIANGMYVADFVTAGKVLLGGNANGDCVIDIRDYGVFICEWEIHYDSNGDSIDDGHTPCGMFDKHADFNGNGFVWQEDYMYIRNNFLETCDPNCCIRGGGGRMGRAANDYDAITSISVADLRAQGLGHLAVADLNGDGWLDIADMNAFAQGVRPPAQRPVPGQGKVDRQ